MICESSVMKQIRARAILLGRNKIAVLILGETGTGKGLLARFIHQQDNGKNKPFIKVNCSALSETLIESELFGHAKGAYTGAVCETVGKFERANGGTLFLDEIGDLTPYVQSKLLNVLEDKMVEKVGSTKPIPIDFRLISATHVNMASAVQKQAFRQDLYYRIWTDIITVPPLRERREDIPFLVLNAIDKFTKSVGVSKTITEDAITRLMRYDYPGNIRELQNIIQRLLAFSPGNEILVRDIERTLLEDSDSIQLDADKYPASLYHRVLHDDLKKIRLAKSGALDTLWHESLRKVKAETFIEFFRRQGGTPFAPNKFHEYMSLRAKGGISYKQCGFYLSVLKSFGICGHNGCHANKKRYYLSKKYLADE